MLIVAIFKHPNENCQKELETINRQYPFEPLKVRHYSLLFCVVICVLLLNLLSQLLLIYIQYLEKTLKLTYEEGIKMLKVLTCTFMYVYDIIIVALYTICSFLLFSQYDRY